MLRNPGKRAFSTDNECECGFVEGEAFKPTLFNPTEEHFMLREMVQDFVKNEVEPQALEHDASETFNRDLFKKMGELGLLAPTVSAEYGGGNMDAVASVIINEELSTSDPGFCLAYLAHSVLYVNNVFINANEEQRKRFLPQMCDGSSIGGVCITEPDGGTDVLGMRTTAVRKGKEYVLNGRKMWITNGAVNGELGDAFLVYAKVDGKITSFIVEKGMPGFSLGQQIKHKLGMRASGTAELVFEDVVVPESNRLGEEGQASLCMMRNLEIERVTLAAQSVGIAKRCVQVMNQYAIDRKAFGQPINRFGQIQHLIADSYAAYQAGRSFLYNVSNNIDLHKPGNRMLTDAVKLFCGPMGKKVADNAIQVLGGMGYVGEGVVERLWRDAKLLEIGGGTNEAHEKNITKDLARDGFDSF
ncbi:isovaleryl-CoA dehydrogenase [Blastocystis sp. ATCC 50177/Nand II]|uniref:Isovaleryl-CoA dehydrogenase n=1 Tax=Blastocystis sp. subtype 1 (strain ATCC 50177 / NandII) TaxID=478820 RepID=A0A196S8D4_BLAHN|nr:isovaleryl-CoA dehydrogenase [Blastocystis sp. ATCC 50177/Nand II]